MKNFKYPVAFKCSEQEGLEIAKRLEELGMEKYNSKRSLYSSKYLVTKYSNLIGYYGFGVNHFNRTIIEPEDVEMGLALAAMVDDDKFYEGEWVYCLADLRMEDNNKLEATKGNLYPISVGGNNYLFDFINNSGDEHSIRKDENIWFRKATKEEIINHFKKMKKKQFTLTPEQINSATEEEKKVLSKFFPDAFPKDPVDEFFGESNDEWEASIFGLICGDSFSMESYKKIKGDKLVDKVRSIMELIAKEYGG